VLTLLDSSLFADVADAIGLSNPTIVEKDYYVVQLLQLLQKLDTPFHQIVFSGGTALAKSSVKTYRMSEDVDLKFVPNDEFDSIISRAAKKKSRKAIRLAIETLIEQSAIFQLEESAIVRDEYRYMCFEIKYPHAYKIEPCLRPYIKLELIESDLLSSAVSRDITSLYAAELQQPCELTAFTCTSIIDTQAEKVISMLRRTASHARDIERSDDATLIRHIYDTHHIQLSQPSNIDELTALIGKVIQADVERYGNQHTQMVELPLDELRFALALLEDDPIHKMRYEQYVKPMVYAKNITTWEEAFLSFKTLVENIFERLNK
jgi:predicted nucleotidyltransferase component of viral defense system